MEAKRLVRALLLAPKRFLDWLYAPSPSYPTRGQTMVHFRAGSVGQDSSRWLSIEEEERRQRDEAIRRVRG